MKINCNVQIKSKNTLSEIPDAWSKKDFLNILDLLGFSDEVSDEEIKEMAMMALADQEPEESAELLLQYRLSEKLTKGQIEQLAHEMQEDKVAEEYPDITIQDELFNVNQLLFKAFNGRFPNCHAIEINLGLSLKSPDFLIEDDNIKEAVIKALVPALGDHSVIIRLFEDEINAPKNFEAADGIIWKADIIKQEGSAYEIKIFSSEYWLHDLPNQADYDTHFEIFEEIEETL